MQLDVPIFLKMAEETGSLIFLDIEATGLRGDYNSVLCVSLKPYGQKPVTFSVAQPGNDQRVVREAKEFLEEKATVYCGYYSKGYDKPMLNTRLLKWGYGPLPSLLHIDLYYSLRYNLLTARRSQGHLLSWLETPEQKMTVGADVWNEVLHNPTKAMKTLIARCESDVAGLEHLYNKTKHLIKDIKR